MADTDALRPARSASAPADLDWFWAIVDGTVRDDRDEQLTALDSVLRALSDQDLVDFIGLLIETSFALYSWRLWAAAYVINGGCSDDGFTDFRAWLIARGRAVAEAALADPESLADLDIEPDSASFEAFGYAAMRAYAARNGGKGPPSYRTDPYPPPSDPDWAFDFENGDEMRRRLPRLTEEYFEGFFSDEGEA